MAQLEGLEAKNHSSQVNVILERRNMSTADTAFLCVLDTKKKKIDTLNSTIIVRVA